MASSLAMHATVFPWLAGFEEACSLRRVASFCSRSRILLIRTGQCFLLNGLIFLGSFELENENQKCFAIDYHIASCVGFISLLTCLFILKPVVIPILLWILPDQYEQFNAEHLYYHKAVMPFYALLRSILIELVYIFWFYPLYIFSFVLRTLWYNDIAKHAFEVLKSKESTTQAYGKNELTESQSTSTTEIPGGGLKGISNVCLAIGEQIYSILLLTLFFIEVFATGFIPYFGKALIFCFFPGCMLTTVLSMCSRCVIPIFFFSPLVCYGVMAILYLLLLALSLD
ncbi:hypothetical protein ZIOFF_016955 [Zingiber officinale]|uniref:Uncharacterized protein n=1 Tax=Zingiber officinale TaxID=94328 RepID=A0A8J5HB51_ZINOF|nr:hypothetical protein ZIOFF_016955 [Zingiber officinale]